MNIDLTFSEYKKMTHSRISAVNFHHARNVVIDYISKNIPLKLGKGSICHIRILKAQMFKNQNGLCDCCRCQMRFSALNSPKLATFEHIKAICSGGENLVENIVLTCSECNSKRQATKYLFFKFMIRSGTYTHIKKFRNWLANKVRSPASSIDKCLYIMYAYFELLIFTNNVYLAHVSNMKRQGKW